jgi:hypothetical protein
MSVDYHCTVEEVADIPEDKEPIKRYEIIKTKETYLLTFYGIHDKNVPDVVFAITNQGTTNYTSVPTITITPTPSTAGVGMSDTCTLTAEKVTSIK